MFRKFHHLLPLMNEKIRTISESGLLTKWMKDSKRVNKKNPLSNEADSGKGGHGSAQMKLRLEHVEGAFIVVIIGLTVAFVVFLLEHITRLLIKHKKKERMALKLESWFFDA